MKIPLELNISHDGTGYLNFWDDARGRDVVCRIGPGGRLTLKTEMGGEHPVTFGQFVRLVQEVVNSEVV